MTMSELKSLIANGENSQVEFKRDDIRPEQLAREIVAFLNTHGGQVLIGVEDNGDISGIQRPDLQEWVLNTFRDKIHPQVIPNYREAAIEDRRVAVVTVAIGTAKPYTVRHNGREDIYLRMGNRTEPATREQQMRLFEAGQMLHVETMPVSGTGLDDLDLDRLGFYLSGIIQDDSIPANAEEWNRRLVGLGLMATDSFGHHLSTVAGLVCFGYKPRRALRQAGLRVQVYDSPDLEYSAVLDRVLDRPLIGRWRRSGTTGKELVDPGLIEECMILIEPFISRDRSDLVDHVRRERQWWYPSDAVRELVLNAFIHRDWTRSVDAEVTIFSNRLQVMSPGALPNSMTLEKMLAGQRFPRNPIIQDILRDYGYVDARGMGIRRKVLPQVRATSRREPEIRLDDDRIVTDIYRAVE